MFIQYDKEKYFLGEGVFNYKELPLNIKTGRIEYYHAPSTEYSEFYFIYNDYEYFGKGSSYVYNEREFKKKGYNSKNKFSVSSIIGYYYKKGTLIIECTDEKRDKRWVKPFKTKGDIIFLEIPTPNFRDCNLKYVKVK